MLEMSNLQLPLISLVDHSANGCEYLIHGNHLHADVVPAGGLTVIKGVHAWAARNAGPQGMVSRRRRTKKQRSLRPEQRDHIDGRHRRKMRRSAVVGYQHIRQAIDDQQLPQRRLAGQTETA